MSACNYIMLLKIGTTIITVKANHNIKKESLKNWRLRASLIFKCWYQSYADKKFMDQKGPL